MRNDLFLAFCDSLEAERPVALATIVEGRGVGRQLLLWPNGDTRGSLGSSHFDRQVSSAAAERLRTGSSGRLTLREDGAAAEVFLEVHPAPPKLVIVGAVHVAVHLVELARRLGFRTVVVDPRGAFATPERFPSVDRLLVDWPQDVLDEVGLDESTYLATLTHDPKIDLPALAAGLGSRARYLGALGSSRTHAKRVEALRAKGWSETDVARIHSPIGLDLGGRRAEEIALSVLAQVVAVRYGKA